MLAKTQRVERPTPVQGGMQLAGVGQVAQRLEKIAQELLSRRSPRRLMNLRI
jgi:hypothetical protein